MWKAIKYLFYNYYLLYKNKLFDYTPPQVTALFVVAWLFMLWLGTFYVFSGFSSHINKLTWLIFNLFILAGWFYVFLHKGRWKEIIKEFENESKQQRKRGRILCVLFTIFTIIMFIASLFFLALK